MVTRRRDADRNGDTIPLAIGKSKNLENGSGKKEMAQMSHRIAPLPKGELCNLGWAAMQHSEQYFRENRTIVTGTNYTV